MKLKKLFIALSMAFGLSGVGAVANAVSSGQENNVSKTRAATGASISADKTTLLNNSTQIMADISSAANSPDVDAGAKAGLKTLTGLAVKATTDTQNTAQDRIAIYNEMLTNPALPKDLKTFISANITLLTDNPSLIQNKTMTLPIIDTESDTMQGIVKGYNKFAEEVSTLSPPDTALNDRVAGLRLNVINLRSGISSPRSIIGKIMDAIRSILRLTVVSGSDLVATSVKNALGDLKTATTVAQADPDSLDNAPDTASTPTATGVIGDIEDGAEDFIKTAPDGTLQGAVQGDLTTMEAAISNSSAASMAAADSFLASVKASSSTAAVEVGSDTKINVEITTILDNIKGKTASRNSYGYNLNKTRTQLENLRDNPKVLDEIISKMGSEGKVLDTLTTLKEALLPHGSDQIQYFTGNDHRNALPLSEFMDTISTSMDGQSSGTETAPGGAVTPGEPGGPGTEPLPEPEPEPGPGPGPEPEPE